MAWGAITNNTRFQYNNSPTDPGDGDPNKTLYDQQTAGVRTHPLTGHKVYTNVRKVGTTVDIGELSKSFWDARS